MRFPLLETALHTTKVPVIMVLKLAIAVPKVFSTALAPEGFGTVTGSNGSLEALSMGSPHPIAHTTCPFILKAFKQAVTTASALSLLWRMSKPFIRTSS